MYVCTVHVIFMFIQCVTETTCIRALVDALYRDGANMRGDVHMLKASMLRECVNMSLLRHLVKLYKVY